MKSIMNTKKGICYVCGRSCDSQEHHIFYGTANRSLSEKYGLKVYLCLNHHTATREAVHNGNWKLDIRLKQEAQRAFESRHGSRSEFMEIFGKNYLED
ncbi:MAG: hypothetical protein PUG60_10450 [Lachnospiraceae bacterium]|nr:hypothetical protein [Lachnospiraceae bacterium]